MDHSIATLEQCLLNVVEKSADASFILYGDLNATTWNKVATYFELALSRFDATGDSFWLDGFTDNDPPFPRCSKDTRVNVKGHKLLVLCSSFD